MINTKKLKVILTPLDMARFNLTNDTMDYGTTATKKAFWDILDRAHRETGFDVSNDKLYVQIFPSHDGGCEMFVTKQPQEAASKTTSSPFEDLHNKYYRTLPSTKKQLAVLPYDFEALAGLCAQLFQKGYRGKSSLFLLPAGQYLLYLDSERDYPSFVREKTDVNLDDYPFLGEFGDVQDVDDKLDAYLSEHAKLLCERDAVHRFAVLFPSR